MKFEDKIKKIKNNLKNKKIAISFSGGADSTLIAYIAKEVAKDVILITFNNGLMPNRFLKESSKQAKYLGLKQFVINKDLMELNNFKENKTNRCFICRKLMYYELKRIAEKNGYKNVIDGTNISDLVEDRPGIMAKYENNILSPLIDAEMESKDVIKFLDINNINYLKTTTCLATRIKQNTPLTRKKLNQIDTGENFIKNITQVDVVKIRDIDGIGIIETNNIKPFLNKNKIKVIEEELNAINFKKIALNISSIKSNEEKIFMYKPCQEEDNKIMFEKELPYKISIEQTNKKLEENFNTKLSIKMGVIMFNINNQNISIFKTGKIVLRRVNSKEEGKNILMKILPLIRRDI